MTTVRLSQPPPCTVHEKNRGYTCKEAMELLVTVGTFVAAKISKNSILDDQTGWKFY